MAFPRTRRRLLVASTAVVVAVFVAASSVLFVWPATGRPQRADAVVSLDGPDEAQRTALAVRLVRDGYAPVLLFSQGAYRSAACPYVKDVKVVCFEPDPARTVGEVRFVARYADARHWRTLIVVPGRVQTTRARLLMNRCFRGRAIMVPASVPWSQMPYQVIYEWGALLKAVVTGSGCG